MISPGIVAAQTQFQSAARSASAGEQTQQAAGASTAQTQSDAGAQTKSAAPASTQTSPPIDQKKDDSEGEQTKRILGIIPNYRAVSASAELPPLSFKAKFVLATQDSFDYSAFLLAGLIAGYGQATNSSSEFGQGARGYGRYYWHSFVDEASGNYLTEAIVPAITREDPRYYTLGHGGFTHRLVYSVTRLIVTRNDAGRNTFNFSEIGGNFIGAGVSNLYYPAQERTFSKTAEKWGTQIGVDGIADVLKEFWPDIRHKLFRQ